MDGLLVCTLGSLCHEVVFLSLNFTHQPKELMSTATSGSWHTHTPTPASHTPASDTSLPQECERAARSPVPAAAARHKPRQRTCEERKALRCCAATRVHLCPAYMQVAALGARARHGRQTGCSWPRRGRCRGHPPCSRRRAAPAPVTRAQRGSSSRTRVVSASRKAWGGFSS